MSLATLQFYSEALKQNTTIGVIMPDTFLGAAFADPPYPLPSDTYKFRTLYLIHGITGDHSEWLRGTNIEFTAILHRVAIVTADAGNSFGKNLPNHANYEDFLTEELPRIAESHFPLSPKRADRGIAGISMGGYAAFRTALNAPDRYAYAASLSGIVDPITVGDYNHPFSRLAAPFAEFAFEKNYDENKDSLLTVLARAKAAGKTLPELYYAIGTEDFLYRDLTAAFISALRDSGTGFTYEEGSGLHDMRFWNEYIEHVLRWFANQP